MKFLSLLLKRDFLKLSVPTLKVCLQTNFSIKTNDFERLKRINFANFFLNLFKNKFQLSFIKSSAAILKLQIKLLNVITDNVINWVQIDLDRPIPKYSRHGLMGSLWARPYLILLTH